MDTVHRSFRFALRPTSTQCERMVRMATARRFVWNWGLERRLAHYESRGESLSSKRLSCELTQLKRKPAYAWLNDADSQALQQGLLDLHRAFEAFFSRRTGFPRFKSRKSDPLRFRIPQRVRVTGDRIFIPKVGWVRARLSRSLPDRLGSLTVRRDAAGTWFATIIVTVSKQPPRNPRNLVGIDLGLRDLIVTSDGMRVPNPNWLAADRRRLRRAHRRLSRSARGGRNRARARQDLARRYKRVTNRRQDFLHKLTSQLVSDYDLLCLEDLGITGLVRTKLSRRLGDAALHELRRQIVYKAETLGAHAVIVDRFFPSSKRCSRCGLVNADLRPRDREWDCACGATLDRDLNAALNLLAEGLRLTEGTLAAGHADTQNACGARVRLPTEAASGEAGTPGGDAKSEVLCYPSASL
jgi:putative transposase